MGGWQSTFDAESSIDKIQITIFAGEGGGGQLLMQSPEMLNSKIPIFASGGGGRWPTFDAESRNAKIQFLQGEGGNKLLILSPELLKSKIPIFAWGGGWQSTFDAESSIDKIQITIFVGEGGWWPTFDAESRNAKIQNSNFCKLGGVGGQLLMLSPEMLKSNFCRGRVATNF